MRKYRKPYRLKKKKSIFKTSFFWLAVLILAILGGIFYLICFFSFFQIKEVKICGNLRVSVRDLQKTTQNKIEKKLLFFSSKSIFLVNSKEIKKEILENYPQIARVEIYRRLPDTLEVKVKERKGIANWCQKDDCFLLDKEGIVFAREKRDDLIKLVAKKNSQSLNLGEKVIEKEYLKKILGVRKELREELGIESQEIVVFPNRFNVKTKEGWEIYFNPKGDLNWQLTKLKALLEKEIPPERQKDLEYIELRFGNFAPYKYRKD